MAKLSHAESRRMYSWWWDSHISPKNSKWLQENLTDMDVKVKSMIKLIEEDADSFARRAEMYYKKRPELMKLVEDFYRAYRALAERYDHATRVIRHAHRTMAEAFPNRDPMMFSDDSPGSNVSGADPRTPDIANLMGELTDESDTVTTRKISKQFDDSVRRGLNFDESEEKGDCMHGNENNHVKDKKLSKSGHESDSEEILALKEAIAKLEAEKEAGLVQYQQSLDKLSQFEREISKTREDFSMLRDHANKAENEVVALKEALATLETEKVSKLQEYQGYVEKISKLQTIESTSQEDVQKLNERANTAENEAQSLKAELDKLSAEKDEALNQYMQSLEIISNLDNKLQLAEEDAARFQEKAEKAESEVENLRQAISKLTEEKEAAALQHQQFLETISSLEKKLSCVTEEAKRLNGEIENGASKLKGAEEQCLLLERSNQSLHSELESLMLRMGAQTQELTAKQKELGRLWACIQEERLRFVEAETAFQTLQHLHAKTQEELQALASELQNRAQLLNVAETQNQSLQDEVVKVKQENKYLDELNSSSALSIDKMRDEISSLMESKGKLEEEAELRLEQRNALQQEIYCLKEGLNDLNKKHVSILDQVHAVGLNPESLGSSVKELQNENSSLKETCHKESIEKAALLQKLELIEQLLEKNALLETSLSDLNAELDAVRVKIEDLEQSCQYLSKEKSTLLDEKATLVTQLEEANKNLKSLSENNTVLETSLSDAHHQHEVLKAKSKILEDSCQLLVNEKADLLSTNNGLTCQLEKTEIRLEDLGKLYGILEGRCMLLENEKESTLRKVEELQMSLDLERQEHASCIKTSEVQFTVVQDELHFMQEECRWRKTELDRVLDFAIANEIETFVMYATLQVLKEKYCFLLTNNQKLLEKFSLSEKKISQIEQKGRELQSETNSLSDQVRSMRVGTHQLLKFLDIFDDRVSEDKEEQDQIYINELLSKLQSMKKSLCKAEEENLEQSVERSVLATFIKQERLDSHDLEVEKNKIEHAFNLKNEQGLKLQSEAMALLAMNEDLQSKLREGDCHKETLVTQVENLNLQLISMQGICEVLQQEKLISFEEKRSLMDRILHLEGKNNVLEEENYVLCDKVLDLENISSVFRSFSVEKLTELRELENDRNKLHGANAALIGKLCISEERFEESESESLHLKERLQKTEDKLKVLEEENYFLCDRVLDLENTSLIFRSFSDEKLMELRELGNDRNKLHVLNAALMGKLCMEEGRFEESESKNLHLKGRLQKTEGELKVLEEENYVLCDKVLALENVALIFRSFSDEKLMELRELGNDRNKLHWLNAALMEKLCMVQGRFDESESENLQLKERLLKTKDELKVLEEENHVLCDKVLDLDNISLIFRSFSDEKLVELRELGNDRNKLHGTNAALMGKLCMEEERFEESESKNLHLKGRLQKTEGELKVLEEENYVLCDKVLALENIALIFRSFSDEKLMELRELGNDRNKLHWLNAALMEKLCMVQGRFDESESENLHLKERLLKTEDELKVLEEENNVLCDKVLDLENISMIFRSFSDEKLMELREIGSDRNKLHILNAALLGKLCMAEGRFENSDSENLHLKERLQKTEDELKVLEEENYVLHGKVFDLENISLIFKSFSDEKLLELRELENDRNILHGLNAALMGKLCMAERKFEESESENLHLKKRLQKTEDDLKDVAAITDQLRIEIDNGKEALHDMVLELQEAGDKISLVEKKKLELNESVEDLRTEYNEVRDDLENQILKLSSDNDQVRKENHCLREVTQKLELHLQELQGDLNKRKIQEENMHFEQQKKIIEINELENQAASVYGQLKYSMISQLLYEQKFNELQDACLGYVDENEGLKTQLAAFGPEILSLKECISSLENQTDIHIKFQNPETEELQGTNDPRHSILNKDIKASTPVVSDLSDLRVRLQAIVKTAVEIKELTVQENINLHSKLDALMKELELLQSERDQYRTNGRPTSEITEADNSLLTKDIVLDQVSNGSSYVYSKRQTACDLAEPSGTVGQSPTIGESEKTVSPTDISCSKSIRKQKDANSDALIEKDLSVNKFDISKSSSKPSQEGNKRRFLERLDSDVQKMSNLQITVRDLRRKLEVIQKSKRGKGVVECEALKRQLEEADLAITELFDMNGRLMKSVDNRSFSDAKSSFDLEGEEGTRSRRVSEQARKMSEKLGRLQLEIQKVQFVLLKMEDEREGGNKKAEMKRKIVLKDFLYGAGRTGHRRKKSLFCGCIQSSTVED